MKRKLFVMAASFLAAFVLWTLAVQWIDVRSIGPQESTVGLAALNQFVHRLTGVHMFLYTLTDWLSLVPLALIAGFAALGLLQWIRRKSILKVDFSLLALGKFYVIVMAVYLFFEIVVINYRPVLIDGMLEASYPSSTTMLVLCVMPTAAMQFNIRIHKQLTRKRITCALHCFTVFMVIGRLISGVHWFTDIVGGTLLSTCLVTMYHALCAKHLKRASQTSSNGGLSR